MRKSALVYIFSLLITLANAQSAQLTGKVTDEKGESLPGTSIHVLGTTTGTISEFDGSYSLIISEAGPKQLVFFYLGLKADTVSVTVEAGKVLNMPPVMLHQNVQTKGEVVISGSIEQGSEAKAINIIKNSVRLVSVVSAETISKYPDHNGAESLKRVAGAAVQNDKGEGAYISLRGTPLDWTATLVNGNRLPIADEENFTRIFEFEVLPSDLVDYIEVTRTVTPDIDGDNIGGSINFKTKSDVDHRIFNIDVAGGTSALTAKPTGSLHFLWADQSKNKKFSYAVNGSYYGRYYGAQAYLLAYGSNFNQGINRFELKDYGGTRQTAGGNLFLQYKFSSKFTLDAKILAGTMIDDKWQQKMMYVYSSGDGSIVKEQNIHGKLNRLMAGGELNAEYKPTSRLKITARLSSFSNRFWYGNVPYSNNDPRNGYYTAEFSMRRAGYYTDVDYINANGTAAAPGTTPYVAKLLDLDNPYGHGDNYRNIQPKFSYPVVADSMEFRRLFTQINNTKELNPVVAELNGTYSITNDIKLMAGGKFYWKTGERDISYHEWQLNKSTQAGAQPFPLTGLNLQAFNARGGYMPELGGHYTGLFLPFLTRSQLSSLITQFGDRWFEYAMNEENSDYRLWVGSNYKYHEYTGAGYLMATANLFGRLNLTGGLRLEYNSMYVTADTTDTKPSIDYTTGYVYFKTQSRSTLNNNLAVLPSLNATLSIKDNQNLRFAISRTYHRQNFAEIKPGAPVINYSDFEFTFGNPNLKPTYSLNLDLAYEYFWGNKGMFSVSTYYKNVTNHIFATTQADADPTSGIVYKSYENSGKSWIWGVEAMVKRKFTFLPRFLSGFGVDANITYSLSRMQVPGRPKAQAMAEQTPLLYNVALFYEKYGVSARLALNYTGGFLKEVNLAAVTGIGLVHKDASYDLFMAENYSLDAQVAYSFKKHFTVFVEANNLLDWPFKEYRGNPNRPVRIEYYRARGQVGFKFSLD